LVRTQCHLIDAWLRAQATYRMQEHHGKNSSIVNLNPYAMYVA
jgi:hypothetical protein